VDIWPCMYTIRSIMIKPGRIINRLINYLPFSLIITIVLTLSVTVSVIKYKTKNSEKYLHEFLQKYSQENINGNVIPLSVISTRFFYLIVETLTELGYQRCDRYLPESDCTLVESIEKKDNVFYEIRNKVKPSPAGYQASDTSPSYKTLKGLVLNTGNRDSKFIGIFIYTHENAGARVFNFLQFLKRGSQCRLKSFQNWYIIEDKFSYNFLEEKFGVTFLDKTRFTQIIEITSKNSRQVSESKSNRFNRYFNHVFTGHPQTKDFGITERMDFFDPCRSL